MLGKNETSQAPSTWSSTKDPQPPKSVLELTPSVQMVPDVTSLHPGLASELPSIKVTNGVADVQALGHPEGVPDDNGLARFLKSCETHRADEKPAVPGLQAPEPASKMPSTAFTPTYRTETVDGIVMKIRNSDGYVYVTNFNGSKRTAAHFTSTLITRDLISKLQVTFNVLRFSASFNVLRAHLTFSSHPLARWSRDDVGVLYKWHVHASPPGPLLCRVVCPSDYNSEEETHLEPRVLFNCPDHFQTTEAF